MKKLDGAGLAKMQTLEVALAHLQRVHGIVERMALAVRSRQDTAQFRQQITRAATPLVGALKAQFGMIADQVAALLLVLTRGGSDQTRLRSLREYVAQIRTALEIAVAKVDEQHAADDAKPGP
ncbi:MAG: hypothetical protein IT361_01680 [Gemmatimonadaceae bacterium]|nr:hypothetical protein [Gemmatimonadaceae bacterium]